MMNSKMHFKINKDWLLGKRRTRLSDGLATGRMAGQANNRHTIN